MDIQALAKCNDSFFSHLFTEIGKMVRPTTITGDSQTPVYTMTSADHETIRSLLDEECKARTVQAFGGFQTPTEAWQQSLLKVGMHRMVGDAYPIGANVTNETQSGVVNNPYKWGTLNDPMQWTTAMMPVSFGPTESTSVYANGGLPTDILNKKTRTMVLNGPTFKSFDNKFWTNDKIEQLEEAAFETGLTPHLSDAILETFLYGGEVLYPVFKGESPTSFIRPMDKLNLDKGCIERWVNVDRWNIVTVPSFIVTAKDYLKPETMLIPMDNVEVNTSRMAILRPKSMPYWAALFNLGWCPSDLSGWIRAYYNYEITQMSVPVMAQQMSLLLYRMPLDGLNATIGPDNVQKLMAVNEQKMAEWNALNPRAVNMVGEVEVVDRTYSGFDQFVGAIKSELAVQCGLPEPSLFHTPNKGFSDNTTESLLKQSETLKLSQQFIERSMNPIRDALIAHVFGSSSEEYKERNKLRMVFDKPIISTEKDLADVGARFAASVNSFVQAGITPDTAIELSKPFFPSVKITDEMIESARKSYEEQMKLQQQTGTMNKVGGGTSGGQIGSGQKAQTGHNTKAQSAKIDK